MPKLTIFFCSRLMQAQTQPREHASGLRAKEATSILKCLRAFDASEHPGPSHALPLQVVLALVTYAREAGLRFCAESTSIMVAGERFSTEPNEWYIKTDARLQALGLAQPLLKQTQLSTAIQEAWLA